MTTTFIEPSEDDFGPPPTWLWQLPFTIGVLQVLFGLAIIVWPDITINVAAILIGLNLLIGGVLRLVMAAVDTNRDGRGVMAMWAVLSVLAGIVMLRAPARSLALLVVLLGAFWVIWGLVEAFVAMTPSARGSRGALFLEAGLAVAAGAVLLAWPEPTLTVFVWIAGFAFLVVGAVALMVGWQLRAAIHELEAAG